MILVQDKLVPTTLDFPLVVRTQRDPPRQALAGRTAARVLAVQTQPTVALTHSRFLNRALEALLPPHLSFHVSVLTME